MRNKLLAVSLFAVVLAVILSAAIRFCRLFWLVLLGAGKLQMAAVKVTRDEIVEAIIVECGPGGRSDRRRSKSRPRRPP